MGTPKQTQFRCPNCLTIGTGEGVTGPWHCAKCNSTVVAKGYRAAYRAKIGEARSEPLGVAGVAFAIGWFFFLTGWIWVLVFIDRTGWVIVMPIVGILLLGISTSVMDRDSPSRERSERDVRPLPRHSPSFAPLSSRPVYTDRGGVFSTYRDYLASPEWKVRRREAIERAGHRCQLCNRAEGLQVHHRTYDRLGHERPEDLIVLCSDCHATFHQHRGMPSRS